jgi:2-polyprenyl-6-methoxyphenol hydroxylase-like FAD-dependent oxidoreductase
LKNTKILICGAGIAGPTLAYWLQRYGFKPTLIERAPALREGGYIIDFWGLGFDIAEKMALLPQLRNYGYEIDAIRFVDRNGETIGGLEARAFRAMLGDRYLSILRGDLARLIYESLVGGTKAIFGESVAAIEQDDDGVYVTFSQAPPERFDLVFGAAGLHSPVRELIFGPEERFERYLGYYAASFSVDAYMCRDPHAYVSYAEPGRQVSRYSLRGNRTVFFFVFSRKSKLQVGTHDLDAQKQLLHEEFGRDGWECPIILEALENCSDLYFDSVSQIRMPTWSQGRVALVGDACFCPSLLAGQGSALAMTGAYILAGELAKSSGDHLTAFGNYERLLHPLIVRKQRAAERFANSFAPKTRFGLFVRNRVTRLMSLPFIARFAMGGLLRDPLTLPTYESL